ncbi:MAG: ATP-binding protein [Candidatus Kapabacteria bacterium]|nr:ATP-binding protein [Candidatus Kapabacteria bacterium]
MKTADDILNSIKKQEDAKSKGRLKIFLGMCAGSGKTYSMLQHAHGLEANHELLVGYIETHGRSETAKLLDGLTVLARQKINYKGIELEEFDLEKTIELKPDYVLVDELAHTNIPGSKHYKRYQDVLELLDNGINVLTTLNVQHIESRSKTVEQITGIAINETVPDSIIEIAENIELVDLPIEELLQRLAEGKVYIPDKAKIATQNFFKTGNLISLREMALRLTAEKVESDLVDYMGEKNIEGPWKAGDKLMVAVGASPFSAELIRWTRRMAYTMKSKWYAVYVKTNINENEKASEQLEKNLRLAKELGAEVITTADVDFVDGILLIARRHNVSQIIIGKPAKYNFFNYIKKDNYIDRLIQKSGNIDIYIVRPTEIKNTKIKKQREYTFTSSRKEYLFAVSSVIIFASICFPFKDILGYQSVGLILLLNLLILPFYVGRGAIFIAALLNFFIWNFFFIPPIFTFAVDKLQDALTLLLNLVIALTSGFLSTKIRKQKYLVQIREQNTISMLNFTKELGNTKNKTEIVHVTLKHIKENLKIEAVFINDTFEVISSSGQKIDLNSKEISIAKWSLDNKQMAGKYTNNLSDAKYQYIPIISNDKIGLLCLSLDSKLNIESENLINNFQTQMAGIYEKEQSRELLQKVELERESQKLYDTLMDSISHEFRTPIAIISGASSTLFDDKVLDNKSVVSELAQEIYSASKRMDMLVENLLDINRLESGMIKLNLDYYPINEVVIEVISQLKDNFGDRKVELDLDKTNPQMIIDFGFIRQALFNILFNTCLYTPENTIIKIQTKLKDKNIQISIEDNGKGLPEEVMEKLFKKFYRVPSSQAGGTGLGLSIAKGFIEAHGGTISARNILPSGLNFEIKLPVYEK